MSPKNVCGFFFFLLLCLPPFRPRSLTLPPSPPSPPRPPLPRGVVLASIKTLDPSKTTCLPLALLTASRTHRVDA